MAVIPLNYEEAHVLEVPATASETFVKGDMCSVTSGLLVEAADGVGTPIRFVAAETITPAANGDMVKVWPTEGVLFIADCDAVWSTVDQGTLCDVATEATLNPDATADDLFFIVKGVGVAETGTKVIGFFSQANET